MLAGLDRAQREVTVCMRGRSDGDDIDRGEERVEIIVGGSGAVAVGDSAGAIEVGVEDGGEFGARGGVVLAGVDGAESSGPGDAAAQFWSAHAHPGAFRNAA